MNEFLKQIAGILEVDEVKEPDDLRSFSQWDSLSVLSVIAMLDANYGVNLRAADFGPIKSAGDLWRLVQSPEANVNLLFSSRVPSQCRSALEDLLFFNPQQHRVREGILESLAEFGQPRLEETVGGLSVRVGNHEAQTLFAYDRDRRGIDPVGVVVFLRTQPTDLAIVHVAVQPDYSLRGCHGGVGLGITLLEKVKEIAARIVGIKRIVFFYRQEVVIKL